MRRPNFPDRTAAELLGTLHVVPLDEATRLLLQDLFQHRQVFSARRRWNLSDYLKPTT